MIIDFHTHLFPDKIAEKAMNVLIDGMIEVQGSLLLPPSFDGTYTSLLKNMEKNSIDLSVVLPIATTPTQHKTINAFAEKITDNKKIISFGSIHPHQEDWEDALEDIHKKGLRGIKLHPEFQDFYVDESIVSEIVIKAKKLGLLVIFHCGVDFGYKPPVKCTPERLHRLIDKTGGENIIAAHLGGFKMWDEVEKHLVKTPIFMETSMAVNFLPADAYKRIIENHGEDKILFGSDSPWQDSGEALRLLYNSGLSESAIEKIKHINAEKLLGI